MNTVKIWTADTGEAIMLEVNDEGEGVTLRKGKLSPDQSRGMSVDVDPKDPVWRVGDHVRLAEDEEEGWPGEEGVIMAFDACAWGVCVGVSVDPEFLDDPNDCGCREVTIEHLVGRVGDDEEDE